MRPNPEAKTELSKIALPKRDPLLWKELKKSIRTHLEVSFLDTREEAIGWAKEDEKSRGQHPRYTRPVPSLSPLPLNQAWIRWLKPCKASKELLKIWQPIKTLTKKEQNVQPQPQPQFQQEQPQWSRPNAGGHWCYQSGGSEHFARNCTKWSRPPPLPDVASRLSPNPSNNNTHLLPRVRQLEWTVLAHLVSPSYLELSMREQLEVVQSLLWI